MTARTKSTVREYVEAIVLAILLTVVIRGLVVQAFRIPTGSMEPTLLVGDFLFVNKLVYGSEIDIGAAGHRFIYYRFPAIHCKNFARAPASSAVGVPPPT